MSKKKRMRDYPEPIYNGWAVWQALRQLGFSADDIFMLVTGGVQYPDGRKDDRPWAHICLRAQGKELIVNIAPTGMSEEAFFTLWREFCDVANAGTFDKDEAYDIYIHGPAAANSTAFVLALQDKGFVLPKFVN